MGPGAVCLHLSHRAKLGAGVDGARHFNQPAPTCDGREESPCIAAGMERLFLAATEMLAQEGERTGVQGCRLGPGGDRGTASNWGRAGTPTLTDEAIALQPILPSLSPATCGVINCLKSMSESSAKRKALSVSSLMAYA